MYRILVWLFFFFQLLKLFFTMSSFVRVSSSRKAAVLLICILLYIRVRHIFPWFISDFFPAFLVFSNLIMMFVCASCAVVLQNSWNFSWWFLWNLGLFPVWFLQTRHLEIILWISNALYIVHLLFSPLFHFGMSVTMSNTMQIQKHFLL